MKTISRREFLKAASTGIGGLALGQLLAACGIQETAAPQEPVPTSAPVATATLPPPPTATAAPTETALSTATATFVPTVTTPPTPDLVVSRNGEPEELVRRAIAAIGGMEKFVPKGAEVVIKPNICVSFRTVEFGATTNPWVVGALVKMCYEVGASKVRVMDHTWRREIWEAYANSGIQKEVEAAGGEMVYMHLDKFLPTDVPLGLDVKSLKLYEDVLNAQVLINVPIAKHHQDAKLTLGMKNLMGVMDERLTMHTNMGQRLADLNSRIRPTLNVMDAVRMLMAFGPTGGYVGDVKKMDTVIVSQDIVALDSYTATLFDMKPDDLEYVKTATAMGLGHSDLENLRIEEINLG